MKKKITKVASYECSICGTDYDRKSDTKNCERRTMEEKIFPIGARVRAKVPKRCRLRDEIYYAEGRIACLRGPKPSDYEYEVKWLGGNPKRLVMHVFQHQINYICPCCKKKKSALYYAPELKLLKP